MRVPSERWNRWSRRRRRGVLTGYARAQIHRLGDQYVLYYTATDQSGVLSVGVATSAHVDGPFDDVIGKPLLRYYGKDPLGVIDPTMVVHEGSPHLIWKDDGNAVGKPTPIWIQQLADDGLSLKGNRHQLISNNQSSWEGGVVEGPWMLRREDYYYLFYSVRAHTTADAHVFASLLDQHYRLELASL